MFNRRLRGLARNKTLNWEGRKKLGCYRCGVIFIYFTSSQNMFLYLKAPFLQQSFLLCFFFTTQFYL